MDASKKNRRSEAPKVMISPMMDRSFVLLRFTLIIATSYLLIAQFGARSVPAPLLAMMALVFLSNVGALALPAGSLSSPWIIGITIVGDTVWITIALIATGRFSAEFFYLYFFVLFLAGVGENLRLIALSVMVVCLAYVVLIARTGGLAQIATTETLIRVPFLFSVAIFYGYLIDRMRRERHQSIQEQAVIAGLERNRRALAEANEELRRLSEVKSKFVSTVSHELKSPLTAIKNAVALIDPDADGATNDKFLQMIRRNADRLHLIISDLLDISKAESGSLTIVARPLELAAFLTEVIEPFVAQADLAGVTLDLDLAENLPTVVCDASRIEQVVANLLSNALKATPAGRSVTIGAVKTDGEHVEISVSDTGIGLTDEDQAKVFEPFFQSGHVLEGKPAGTGLGLTICRDLVRGHGSDLHIESRIGEGSRFWFAIPVKSDRGYETISFENQVRTTYRAHPYFVVLVIDCGHGRIDERTETGKKKYDAIHQRLQKHVPRALDVVCGQPAHGRIILVLLSTPLPGGWVVKRKLASALQSEFTGADRGGAGSVKVLGPAGYPDHGDHGTGLIERAIQVGEKTEEET